VLTGQYSRYRTSANASETTLAAGVEASSFGLTNFYQFPPHTLPARPTPPGGNYTFEPAVAQPLYITSLPVGGVSKNVLLVGSLDDYLYAFDTSDGAVLWSVNLANDCGNLVGVPFDNNYGHNPGGTNLVYYGVVATPVIDIYSDTAPESRFNGTSTPSIWKRVRQSAQRPSMPPDSTLPSSWRGHRCF
jgi:outer membrane protein assembly factor BamB